VGGGPFPFPKGSGNALPWHVAVHMADLILVLAGGRVVETGSRASLMVAGGLYAELFSPQAEG